MRHESISTTLEFYVGRNADATAEAAWSAVAKHSAKHADPETAPGAEEKPQTL